MFEVVEKPDSPELQEIVAWLEAEAERRRIQAKIYTDTARLEGGWFQIHVYVSHKDPYDFAKKLGKLEDSWNDRKPKPEYRIVLLPAAR